jgi:hypothetical protein
MADVTVKARVVLQDDASRSLVGLKGHLKDLMQGNVGAAMTGSLLAGNLMGLASGAMSAAGQIAQTTWELGKLGAESQRSQASFERLASGVGESGQAMLRAMQEASRGTVSNSDLMMAANRALVLGVADSAEEMADLVEAAIIRGRDVGVGATQAVNDLVTGIGRMSPQILDNLGIVGAQQEIEAYAKSLGKTAEQLTDVEKKQALLNAVLASTEGVEIVDDAASSFERMETSIANAQSALGELFSPAVAAIAQSLADTVNGALSPATADMSSSAALLGGYFGLMGKGASEAGNAIGWLGGVMSDGLGITQANARAQYEQSAAFHDSIYGAQMLAGATAQLSGAQAASLPAIDAVTQGLIVQTQAARQAITATAASQSAGLRSTLLGMAGDLGGTGALNQYKELNAELAERTARMQSWGYTAEQIEFANAAWIENTTAALREQSSAFDDLGTVGSRAMSGIGSAASGLQSTLSGLVSAQLQGAFSLDGISVPGGPRQDDVNENARRLAAIANEGLIGQDWLGEFAAEAPGTYADLMLKIAEGMDAQSAAQMLLGQFQSGLRPDLLDFDMIKQRVKDQLTSQQAIEEMTGELTSQLMAEMGVSAQQVQGALGALGLGGAGDGGTSAGDALSAGFEAGVDGNQIAFCVRLPITTKRSLPPPLPLPARTCKRAIVTS